MKMVASKVAQYFPYQFSLWIFSCNYMVFFSELEQKLTGFFRQEFQLLENTRGNEDTLIVQQTPLENCKHKKFSFLNGQRGKDYILFNGHVPQLKDVSICAWVSRNSFDKGTLLSYYKKGSKHGNSLTIYFNGNERMGVMIHGSSWSYWEDTTSVASRSHLCVLISTAGKWADVFTNGKTHSRKKLSGFDGEQIDTIPGGGALVIGTDQDESDTFVGKIDSKQTFLGEIQDLYIWDRIINETDMLQISKDPCFCPKAYLIGFNANNTQVYGNVALNWNATCQVNKTGGDI